MKIITTLCLVYDHPKILLGMKKRGFGAGRWNGFGGKVHSGETVEEGAKRELLEESGIAADKVELRGILDFEFPRENKTIEMNIFRVDKFQGEPIEGEEMKPQWFHIDEIPFHQMWPDDLYWMPMFLENKKFKGSFLFGEHDSILKYELIEV